MLEGNSDSHVKGGELITGVSSGAHHSGGSGASAYIDPVDVQMLNCKNRIDLSYYKQPLTKWMNTAWDSFRIVDNNTNNVIFMLPDDPLSSEFQEYAAKVSNPTINLETIR